MNSDPIEQFRKAILDAGLIPPDEIIGDGELHSFPTNGTRRDNAGRYILFLDGNAAGWFKDWRSGIEKKWRMSNGPTRTPAEETEYRVRIEAIKRERAADAEIQRKEAAFKAQKLWETAVPASPTHPYLQRKQVEPVNSLRELDMEDVKAILGYHPQSNGEKLAGRVLVVPIKVGDEISTCELIDVTGRKTAICGGKKAGGYWCAQPLPDGDGAGVTLEIGEGVATMLSIMQATGNPVVASLCASNMVTVARTMRTLYPHATIRIVADVDKETEKPNSYAVDAARCVDGRLAVPDFGFKRQTRDTDFNDLHRVAGIDAVLNCLAAVELVEPTMTRATATYQRDQENASDASYVNPSGLASESDDVIQYDDLALATEAKQHAEVAAKTVPHVMDDEWSDMEVTLLNGPRSSQRMQSGSGLDIVFADQLPGTFTPLDELVEGVLTVGGMSVLYGDSNCGKTFLAIDIGCAVARGVPWMGRETESGLVIYLAAESPLSVDCRLQAYQKHHGVRLPNFAIVESPIDLFSREDDTDALVQVIHDLEDKFSQPVRLIVGDTLARLSAGANENAGQDMGMVVRRIDRIRNESKAHFLVVHHSGKNPANGARGWSGIRAAVDTEMEVIGAANGHYVGITKQRDLSSKGERIGFRLESVPLGFTKHGKPVTSCIVMPATASQKHKQTDLPSGCNQSTAMKVLDEMFQASGHCNKPETIPHRPCVEYEAAVTAIASRLDVEQKRKKERARTALTGLIEQGIYGCEEGWIWRAE